MRRNGVALERDLEGDAPVTEIERAIARAVAAAIVRELTSHSWRERKELISNESHRRDDQRD
jgi:hypothetical protein